MPNTSNQRIVRGERYTVVKDGSYLRGLRTTGLDMETLQSPGPGMSSPAPTGRSHRVTAFRSFTRWTRTGCRWPTTASSRRTPDAWGIAFLPRVNVPGAAHDKGPGMSGSPSKIPNGNAKQEPKSIRVATDNMPSAMNVHAPIWVLLIFHHSALELGVRAPIFFPLSLRATQLVRTRSEKGRHFHRHGIRIL